MSTLTTPPDVTAPLPRQDAAALLPKKLARSRPLLDREIVALAARASFAKFNPLVMRRNPVMFLVEAGATLTTLILARDLVIHATGVGFTIQIGVWLWFTVLFANFAEAMAEAR